MPHHETCTSKSPRPDGAAVACHSRTIENLRRVGLFQEKLVLSLTLILLDVPRSTAKGSGRL